MSDGVKDIPIEERDADEVLSIDGVATDGTVTRSRIVAPGSNAANPAFDVTPARLVTGLVTERGVCPANAAGLKSLFDAQAAE